MTRIVAIDPSTTRIGWAFFAGGRLERAGLVLPERTADDWYDRACSMVDELWPVIERAAPRTVIVEVPSEGRGSGSQAGATGRLAVYGCAVGMVLHDLRMALPDNLVDPCSLERVTEREWTRGRPKRERAEQIRIEHPELDWSADRGLDMADAIGLGQYWIDRAAIQEAAR